MPNILTQYDKTVSGDTVIEASNRTFAANTPVTYLGAEMSGCPIRDPDHSGSTIATSNTSGRTTVCGKAICSDGAAADCGCTINASHTSRTFC